MGSLRPLPGEDQIGFSGDGGPATCSTMVYTWQFLLAPDNGRFILQMLGTENPEIGLPRARFIPADIMIPSTDGKQFYVLNSGGRHLKTLNTLTGSVIYQFNYDRRPPDPR